MKYKDYIRFNLIYGDIRPVVSQCLADGFVPVIDEPIEIGDLYYANKNDGGKLLTCAAHGEGFIIPAESGEYCYDWRYTVKVKTN